MTYESARLSQNKGFPVSYQSINTASAEHVEEDDGLPLHPQTTDKTNGRRVYILLFTVIMSLLTLSSVLLPLFNASHPKLDPLMTGFVTGPLSLSMVHRDSTTSYYEVLDNSYDVINGHPVKRVLVTHSLSLAGSFTTLHASHIMSLLLSCCMTHMMTTLSRYHVVLFLKHMHSQLHPLTSLTHPYHCLRRLVLIYATRVDGIT